MIDHYKTISKSTDALLKEKASKFYAYAFQINTLEEVEIRISELKKLHQKAGHFCYAYFLKPDRNTFRANDDGEPSGTAGKPILGQLEKNELTNTLIVVVRYFGGTKLGTSGLIKAYKEAAALCLEKADIIEKFITGKILISSSFDKIGSVMNVLSNLNLKIVNTDYHETADITIECRISELELNIDLLKAKFLNRSPTDIEEDTEVEGITFTII